MIRLFLKTGQPVILKSPRSGLHPDPQSLPNYFQMTKSTIQQGLFFNEIPYITTGTGNKAIAIFPQIRASFEDIRSAPWAGKLIQRLKIEGCRTFLIGRKKSLPGGYTTRDMAQDYEKVLEKETGPCSIIGISLGGLIAQHVAADHPHLTQKLVLAVSGHSIVQQQHAGMELWIKLAKEKKWKTLYLNMAYLMHSAEKDEIDQWLSPLLDKPLRNPQPDPSDFIVSMKASMAHNSAEKIKKIKAKTLVIGGINDPLFPPKVLEDTANRITGSQIHLIHDTGHGAFDEKKKTFDRSVLTFLSNPAFS